MNQIGMCNTEKVMKSTINCAFKKQSHFYNLAASVRGHFVLKTRYSWYMYLGNLYPVFFSFIRSYVSLQYTVLSSHRQNIVSSFFGEKYKIIGVGQRTYRAQNTIFVVLRKHLSSFFFFHTKVCVIAIQSYYLHTGKILSLLFFGEKHEIDGVGQGTFRAKKILIFCIFLYTQESI